MSVPASITVRRRHSGYTLSVRWHGGHRWVDEEHELSDHTQGVGKEPLERVEELILFICGNLRGLDVLGRLRKAWPSDDMAPGQIIVLDERLLASLRGRQ